MFVVTVAVTADVLLRGQLKFLAGAGFDVTVIAAPGAALTHVAEREGVAVVPIAMEREIAPRADGRSLRALALELRRLAPDIVNASTAKGGLLGMLAATRARVPIRVYQLRGLRLETEHGAKRAVLAATETIAAGCATDIVCNSESLRMQYAGRFAPARKCRVLGPGSSNGVDVQRFARSRWQSEARGLRDRLQIASDAPVVGFIGRPVADKGIDELLAAMERVRDFVPAAQLVLVGAGFAGDQIAPRFAARLLHAGVHVVDHVDEPAPYYALFDVLAFPSHREGMPNVPLEAAAAGVPAVGARATGVCDVIVDGVTGTLVQIGDAAALADALTRYLTTPALRRAHGDAARERVTREYAREIVWERWRAHYVHLLSARGLPLPV